MPFLVQMLHPLPVPAPLEPYLLGVHSLSGIVWVWGGRTLPGPGPRRNLARVWAGTTWVTHDRDKLITTEALSSGFSDGAGGAWTSGSHLGFSTLAAWGGSAWTDVFTDGAMYLAGLSATALYAIQARPTSPDNTLQYYVHTGGGWGSRQSVTPTGTSYAATVPIIIGDGIPTHSAAPAGVRATVCPDGTILVTGGGSETGTLHRYAFVWMLQSGTATEVKLDDQEPDGAQVRYDGIWAADDTHIYLTQGAGLFGGSRTLYLWDRTPGDPWVSQAVPGWGCGATLHGVAVDDWWMLNDAPGALQISHWDGAAYTDYSLPDPISPDSGTTTLWGVWAAATDDVWVVGESADTTTGHTVAPVWHWDGASWAVQTVFTS